MEVYGKFLGFNVHFVGYGEQEEEVDVLCDGLLCRGVTAQGGELVLGKTIGGVDGGCFDVDVGLCLGAQDEAECEGAKEVSAGFEHGVLAEKVVGVGIVAGGGG